MHRAVTATAEAAAAAASAHMIPEADVGVEVGKKGKRVVSNDSALYYNRIKVIRVLQNRYSASAAMMQAEKGNKTVDVSVSVEIHGVRVSLTHVVSMLVPDQATGRSRGVGGNKRPTRGLSIDSESAPASDSSMCGPASLQTNGHAAVLAQY